MENRPFGRTGFQVSAIGFGGWEIGGGYGRIEETEFARAVGRALDVGINCFDTAEGTGLSASDIGTSRTCATPAARASWHRSSSERKLRETGGGPVGVSNFKREEMETVGAKENVMVACRGDAGDRVRAVAGRSGTLR